MKCRTSEIYIFENGEHGEDILTYRILHERSNKIARLFVDKGIGKGDTFAIYMRNHPEFICGMMAGVTIGAIAVPVDPRNKGERLKFLLNNCKARAVIVSGECLEDLEAVIADVPTLRFITVAYQPGQNIAVSTKYHALNEVMGKDTWKPVEQQIMDVRHPMQIIYTSGTTGDPKGVMIRNNRTGLFNILNSIVWKYKSDDILYNGLSLTHGNAQAVTLFPPSVWGSRRFSARDLQKAESGTSAASMDARPSLSWEVWRPASTTSRRNPMTETIPSRLSSVPERRMAIWEGFEKRFNVQILEWYGAVEGGFAYKPLGQGPVGSFGKPVPGVMEFKVVDDNDNPVLAGQTGELISRMIRGDTKVDYLGLPEESQDKTKGGWLRSGDMVHKDENGWYFFDFRKGTELRRFGDFIQPDFVESIIGRHPDVSEACVYGIPAASGSPGESDLVAAIAPFEDKVIDPASVYQKCKNELQGNFIPSYLHVVKEIPKTITEKALTRVLKEMFEKKEGDIYKYEDFK
ncbi:MAG: acyl--CoA ligase [Candidatus Moduliflexus flocculans]|nr:acyl--CoA ligase [Candidatus Moduliflexus flocculans]